MKGATIAGGAVVIILVFVAFVQTRWALEQYVGRGSSTSAPPVGPRAAISPAPIPSNGPAEEANQDFLYGRVTTDDGATYEGRLRFGGDEEAFWGNYFNGVRTTTRGPSTFPRSGSLGSAPRWRSSGSRSLSGSARSISAGP
jgi:hypothetical protein